jgi:outer membrane lipoprotein carrier protein
VNVFRSGRGTFASGALVVMALATPRADQQSPPSAAELAARIQARQQTVRDFTTDFTLKTTSPLLPREPEEQGTLKIKKPGRMRQIAKTGEKNEFVADGQNLYLYFRRDGYVEITPLPTGDQASTWSMFLTGRGDLVRDFVPRLAATHPPNEWHLILTPRQTPASFKSLTLHVDRATLQLRGLVVQDTQETTSTYRFSGLRENTGLSDRDFEFTVPKGVAVRKPTKSTSGVN